MDQNRNRGGLILGAILIAAGILFFVGQVVDFLNMGDFWPFIIIGVGVAFFAGMVLGGKSAGPLAIPGSIISGVGLILLVQNALGWWETWSYAWGLIIVAVGVGIAIYGYWSDKPESVKGGWETARVGLVLFLVFGFIMEFVFSYTGVSNRGSLLLWSALLALLGVVQLVWRAFRLITDPEGVSDSGRDLLGPIIMFGIGLLAAMAVLNILPAWDLFKLISLWPLVLIAVGFHLIVGRRSPWWGVFVGVALLAVILVIALAGDSLGIQLGAPFPIFISGESWQVRERIQGDGSMGERGYEVSNFDRVTLKLVGRMEIVQGDGEALTILGEENILDAIRAEVSGGELVIDVEPGIGLNPTKEITYQLRVKDLSEVNVSAAGDVRIGTLETDSLALRASGVGNFVLEDLQAGRLDVRISGSGSCEAAGAVDQLSVNISGAGNFQSPDLQTQEAEVRISGLGNATLWVENRLDARISGAGNISYYGDPRVDQNISGAGVVHRLGGK